MPSLRRRKPAPKRKAAQKSVKRGSRRGGSAAPSSRTAVLRSHGAFIRHFESLAGAASATRGSAVAFATSAGLKKVSFACDNPAVQVTISTTAGAQLLQPSATFNLPAGPQKILWSAQGTTGANFNVAVTGGTMDDTITGPLPSGGDGGLRELVVS
jgi:hypothetical protein